MFSTRSLRSSRRLLALVSTLSALAVSAFACGEGGTNPVANCGPGTVDQGGQCVLSADALADGLGPDVAPPIDCGPGTVLMDDQCVPEGEIPVCGEGTLLVDGECIPTDEDGLVCGAGTILDEATAECIPDGEAPVCGAGTILDAGTGECVPDGEAPVCGAGTVLMNGECVPDGTAPVCGMGTTLDPATGECIPDGTAPICGAGTLLMNGECVPETDAPVCGDGTTLIGGECVPDGSAPVCGAGTTLDQGTGECLPDSSVVCGADTLYDTTLGQCVADLAGVCGTDTLLVNGQCLPVAELARCGANTVDTNGECVPNGDGCAPGTAFDAAGHTCVPDASTCAAGTTFDAATSTCLPGPDACAVGTTFDVGAGTCVPDTDILCGAGTVVDAGGNCAPEVVCGADTVAWQGECRTPIEVAIAGADVVETLPDANDPTLGTPEVLTLPTLGAAIVFTGTVEAPADIDSDGELEADIDAWRFDASAGDLIHLSVETAGSVPLGFRITGPAGFERLGPLLFDAVPDKELFLPWTGAYTIEIAPQVTLAAPAYQVAGGPDGQYAAVLERLAVPTPVQLTTTSVATGDVLTGNHFFSTPSTPGLYSARLETDVTVRPALVVADSGATPIGESLTGNHVVSTVVPANFVLFTDYEQTYHAQGDFTLTTDPVTLIPLGYFGNVGSASKTGIAPRSAAWFALDYTTRQVTHLRLTSANSSVTPDVRIIDLDSGEVVFARDDMPLGTELPWLVPSATGGAYALEVYNDSSSTTVDYALTAVNWPVVALGTLAAGISTTKTSSAGAMGTNAYRYYLVSSLGGARELTFRAQPASGTVDITVYDDDMVAIDSDPDALAGEAAYVNYVFTDVVGSFSYLMGVRSQTSTSSHTVTVRSIAKPRAEVEPNDTVFESDGLSSSSERVLGTSSRSSAYPEPDVFNFSVASSGSWTVHVDALSGTSCNGFELRDANNNLLGSDSGAEASVTRNLTPGATYIVRVNGVCNLPVSTTYDYVLRLTSP